MASPRIDAHAHALSADLLREAARDGARHGVQLRQDDAGRWRAEIGGAPVRAPVFPDLVDREARWAHMARQGVDLQIVSSWNEFFGYQLEAQDGAWWARLQNETLAAVVAAAPDRLAGLAMVPLQDPPAAACELRHAVGQLGMRGVMICTNVRGENLDAPELDPFWAAAEEIGVPVMLHPAGAAGAGAERMGRYFLSNLVGNPTDTTLAVASLIFGGVLERFPSLRFVLVHGGGFVPYQLGRLQKGYEVRADIQKTPDRRPLDVFRRFYYDTLLQFQPALEHLVRTVGPERLLFGTDYPFEMADRRSLDECIDTPLLDAPSREAVAGGTAARLFSLKARPAARGLAADLGPTGSSNQ